MSRDHHFLRNNKIIPNIALIRLIIFLSLLSRFSSQIKTSNYFKHFNKESSLIQTLKLGFRHVQCLIGALHQIRAETKHGSMLAIDVIG